MWKTDKKPMMTRQGQNNKRMRPRNPAGGMRRNTDASLKNKVFDSNGPGVRVKGTVHQVFEKYISHARDANSSGDRIVAENFYQHAEHYARMANEAQRLQAEETAAAAEQPQPQQQPQQSHPQQQQNQPASQSYQQGQQPQHADAPKVAPRQAVPDTQPDAEQPQQSSADNKAPAKSPRVSLGRRSTSRAKPAESTSVVADAAAAETSAEKPTRKVHAKRTIVKSEDKPQESSEKASDVEPKESKRLIAS